MSDSIKKQLQEIINQEPQAIKAVVARELMEQEDLRQYLEDLYYHGCISGMVDSMIYYHDTYSFFDKHYDEILEIRGRVIEEGLINEGQMTDLKNDWAWIAFEHSAQEIGDALGFTQLDQDKASQSV